MLGGWIGFHSRKNKELLQTERRAHKNFKDASHVGINPAWLLHLSIAKDSRSGWVIHQPEIAEHSVACHPSTNEALLSCSGGTAGHRALVSVVCIFSKTAPITLASLTKQPSAKCRQALTDLEPITLCQFMPMKPSIWEFLPQPERDQLGWWTHLPRDIARAGR
jgi:hypothetical protein